MTLPAVLITGGATRIGAEIAQGFAKAGWHVVIHYNSSSDPAESLANALPSAEIIQCDLTDDNAAAEMICDLASRLSDWRCLINSASVFNYDSATDLDPATNRQAMQINALSPARMSQMFLAHATSSSQRCVIQITDMKLANPNPDFFSYTMSKHALASTIGMLAKSTERPGDRIYGIAPGAILASHDQSEEETEVSHRLNLLGRKTGASEIVEAALFLSKFVIRSGQTLYIDSGQHLLDQDRDVIWLAREQAKARRASV
ncbi:SDR family oxidoreductase [Erythrobacter ani]|uniref:SDR family oxidoreductase n=1 Tax=Erythrobacter ani TaxID=2827235 RepID=A0ABS6SP14_9SPHN|nr:SDR family oxidoreductase [Erythrobacter ani]MBV7266773.1 SDR family oxidoreductase [Erythrobacter ani]